MCDKSIEVSAYLIDHLLQRSVCRIQQSFIGRLAENNQVSNFRNLAHIILQSAFQEPEIHSLANTSPQWEAASLQVPKIHGTQQQPRLSNKQAAMKKQTTPFCKSPLGKLKPLAFPHFKQNSEGPSNYAFTPETKLRKTLTLNYSHNNQNGRKIKMPEFRIEEPLEKEDCFVEELRKRKKEKQEFLSKINNAFDVIATGKSIKGEETDDRLFKMSSAGNSSKVSTMANLMTGNSHQQLQEFARIRKLKPPKFTTDYNGSRIDFVKPKKKPIGSNNAEEENMYIFISPVSAADRIKQERVFRTRPEMVFRKFDPSQRQDTVNNQAASPPHFPSNRRQSLGSLGQKITIFEASDSSELQNVQSTITNHAVKLNGKLPVFCSDNQKSVKVLVDKQNQMLFAHCAPEVFRMASNREQCRTASTASIASKAHRKRQEHLKTQISPNCTGSSFMKHRNNSSTSKQRLMSEGAQPPEQYSVLYSVKPNQKHPISDAIQGSTLSSSSLMQPAHKQRHRTSQETRLPIKKRRIQTMANHSHQPTHKRDFSELPSTDLEVLRSPNPNTTMYKLLHSRHF